MTSYSRHYWAKGISLNSVMTSSQITKISTLANEKHAITNLYQEQDDYNSYGPSTYDQFHHAIAFDLENEEILKKEIKRRVCFVKEEYLVMENKAAFLAFPDYDVEEYNFELYNFIHAHATHLLT
jgi:hypothetical protein